MTDKIRIETLQNESHRIETQINQLAEQVDQLPEAVRVDLQPRVERLQTFQQALARDVREIARPGGADLETAEELAMTATDELRRLSVEVETLSQGNPTSVDTLGDAAINAAEKTAAKVSDTAARTAEKIRASVAHLVN